MANPSHPLPLDIEQSKQLAARLPPKLSVFERAWRTAAQLSATSPVYYVQGFVADARPQPQEHAWVELPNRRLDPSLSQLSGSPQTFGYFPSRRFTVPQVERAIAMAQEDYPEDEALPIYDPAPYTYYGNQFLGGIAYQQAWDAAIAHQR